MKTKRKYLIFFLLGSSFSIFSRVDPVDSLKTLLKNVGNDKQRCEVLFQLSENADEIEWPKFNRQLYELSNQMVNKLDTNDKDYPYYAQKFASAMNNESILEERKGKLSEAAVHLQMAMKIFERYKNGEMIAACKINLANNFNNRGDISRALQLYSEALNAMEEYDLKEGIATALNNIANIYQLQGDYDKAIELYLRSEKIAKELNDVESMSTSLNNMALIHMEKKDYKSSREFFHRSMELSKQTGDKLGWSAALANLANVELRQKNFKLALDLNLQSMKIEEEIENFQGVAQSLYSAGFCCLVMGDNAKAIVYSEKSKEMSLKMGLPREIAQAAVNLFQIYKIKGDYKKALENYELCIRMRDSISNQDTKKASIRSQLKYEYEKQATADSVAFAKEAEIKSAELSRQSAEIKAKKNQQYALFGGLFLVILFSIFMFNRFRVTQKQKVLIEHQKEIVEEQKMLVEEKQKEILDSMRYARRIQMAQIPSESLMKRLLERTKK
jgi:tetratricopeptide (TPR) repeat protein